MHKTSKAKFRSAAIVAVLLFAGFGCRPILDATQEKQLTVEERRQESIWAKERPTFDFAMEPDGTGKAFVYFKTQPNSTVTVELTGPGVVSEPRQTLPVNEDGSVAFEWKINRHGRYDYKGSVTFNRITVYTFEDFGSTGSGE